MENNEKEILEDNKEENITPEVIMQILWNPTNDDLELLIAEGLSYKELFRIRDLIQNKLDSILYESLSNINETNKINNIKINAVLEGVKFLLKTLKDNK